MQSPDEILVSSLEGNRQMLDGGSMFGNAPRELWARWIQPDDRGRIPLACRSLLVEMRDKKILCEVGIGAFFSPDLADRYGVQNNDRHLLLEQLSSRGISHEDIDFVVLSHLHFDHAGGLLPPFDEIQKHGHRLLFPNAHYVVGKEAWERAQSPHYRDRASFVPEIVELLKKSDRLVVFEGDRCPQLFPESIRFFTSDGHTPGQKLIQVQGNRENIMFCGDLIPGRFWVHLPITMGYDRFPEILIDEKLRLYQEIQSQPWLFFFTHDPDFCASKIHKQDRKWLAQNEVKALVNYRL